MANRIIDISVSLMAGIESDPPHSLPAISYQTHAQTAQGIADYFGIEPSQLPDGEYCAVERCTISTHHGTHLDAPYHYAPVMNERTVPGGEPSWTIEEVPLEWCFQPAVKLDFRHIEDGYVLTAADLKTELKRIGHTLSPLEIVVINTRAGSRYGEADYIHAGCGVGREGTLYLLDQGIRLMGTDGWSWDAPFLHTRERVRQTNNPDLIWEGHKAGREIGYSHLEKLSNLDRLPPIGAQIVCFPVKVHRASAGWTRAVALVPA